MAGSDSVEIMEAEGGRLGFLLLAKPFCLVFMTDCLRATRLNTGLGNGDAPALVVSSSESSENSLVERFVLAGAVFLLGFDFLGFVCRFET